MNQTLVSVASLIVVGISTMIAYVRYTEYKNEIQRGLYQSIVGNTYEFEITESDEVHQFEVVNVDVDTGHLPGRWRTIVVIEFDVEEFPWDAHDDEVAENAAKDLRWTFNLLSPETPEIGSVSLFDSYKAPALMVSFPSTNLYHITDFLRKTQETIGHVFWHYENDEMRGMTMRNHATLLSEHLQWIIKNSDLDD